MGEALVMHRIMEYTFESIPDVISYTDVKKIIGNFVEIAMRVDSHNIDKLVPNCNGEPGIVVFCDETGRLKNLDLTYLRPWDNAPLVGKLVWLSFVPIVTEDGPDLEFRPLTSRLKKALLGQLNNAGWGELIHFDETASKKDTPISSKLGRA